MKRNAKRKPKNEEPLVNAFTARHGDYRHESLSVTAGEFDDAKHGQVKVIRNRGGSTVQRWIASGLDQSTINAIDHYTRAWRKVFREPRVVANLSPAAFIRNTGDDDRSLTVIDAKETLKRLDEQIFAKAPKYYFDVWQDIVIYDRPAREVGGNGRSSSDRAKTICLFIADMIATVERL